MSKIIDLTDEQFEAIRPLIALVGDMADEGKPGMLLAQIFDRQMKVGVMPHEKATAIQAALGSPPTTARYAHDKPALPKSMLND